MLLLGGIGAVGFVCQWVAWRTRFPAILFLLLCGLALGPGLNILDTDALFGDLLFPFVSLSVAVILFEGSLTLKRSEVHDIGPTVRNMVTTGIIINSVIVTVATHYAIGLSWQLSALFGSIMVVTGPTVIMPMLRAMRLRSRVAKVLRWEGILIDPIGALMAVLVFEFIVSQQTEQELTHVFLLFGKTVGIGVLTGMVAAHVLGILLRRNWIPEFLQNYATLAMVCGTFAASDYFAHESGLVAVTIMGIWLVNMKGVHVQSILHFKENLTMVFVSILFIILAARLDFAQLQALGWGAIIVLLVMQFIARPAKVFFSTFRSTFTLSEKLILSWVGPRGIVAAAVSAIFALRLEKTGVEGADLIVPLAFTIIIGTVLMQGLSARIFASMLKVTEPSTKGYLIVGGNKVALVIAKALKDVGINNIVCDSYWDNISAARMAGLQTYYGNPISNHADLYLDTTEYDGVLGLSYFHERNMTAALRYREDFGVKGLFCLGSKESDHFSDQYHVDRQYSGNTLFADGLTYEVLNKLIVEGAEAKKTVITEEYTYENWLADHDDFVTHKLFSIDAKRKVHWQLKGRELQPKAGWTLVYLRIEKKV